MLVLAVKVLMAPTFVAGASLAARRYGPWIGGVLAGLPVVAGPILFAYALTHGRVFAQHAAIGTLLGLSSLSMFALTYGRLARHLDWWVCLFCGWCVFGACTALLDGVSVSAGPALVIAFAGLITGRFLLPGETSDPQQTAPSPPPSWDLSVRGACALALVLVLTTASGWLGPRLSGLLAPFPVITTVMAVFTHAQRGAFETVRLLGGMLSGYVAFALFCFTLALSLTSANIAGAFLLALAVTLVAQAAIIWWSRRAVVDFGDPRSSPSRPFQEGGSDEVHAADPPGHHPDTPLRRLGEPF